MPNRVRNPWHKRFANAGHTWLQDILHGYCINERLNITTDTFWALRFVRNENLTVHSLESIVWPTSFILDLMSIPLIHLGFSTATVLRLLGLAGKQGEQGLYANGDSCELGGRYGDFSWCRCWFAILKSMEFFAFPFSIGALGILIHGDGLLFFTSPSSPPCKFL